MKSRLLLDQFADTSTITEDLAAKVQFKPVKDGGKPVAYFPAGTIFEGPQALQLCYTGQAKPADDECVKAFGLSQAEQDSLAMSYLMDTLGITDQGDRELFRARVIAGINPDGTYIHGDNWDAYNEALNADDEEIE